MKRLGIYFPLLDELRFIAFLLVFWSHSYASSLRGYFDDILFIKNVLIETGGIGVHLFFVLSGFLITYLLILEFTARGKVSVKNFYIRRTLRIWPVYFIVMLSGLFLFPHIFSVFNNFCGNKLLNLTFLNNFDDLTTCYSPNIGIAWSVAIEEQFYLFYPILFVLIIRKLTLLILTCFLIFIFSCFFIIFYDDPLNFHTFGNLNYLMVGCLGAFLYFRFSSSLHELNIFKKWGYFLLVLFGILALTSLDNTATVLLLPFLYLHIVVFLVIHSDITRITFIAKMGKYTYGMYMYHPIILILFKAVFDKLEINYQFNIINNFIMSTVALIITICVSIVSYQLFESRILRIKDRYCIINTRY